MYTVFRHWYDASSRPIAGAIDLPAGSVMLTIWDSSTSSTFQLPLEHYVHASTAAEMPAAYHAEALKAQAVAIRTRAVASAKLLGGNGCRTNPSCDLCTDETCCQAYASPEQLKLRWKNEYPIYNDRITQAVRATEGQILTWHGEPIQILYHACSGGKTEDAKAVFSQSLPYLVSVESPGEEFFPEYTSSAAYSLDEACRLLLKAFPDSGITPRDLAGQLRLQSTTASGRVASVLIGTRQVTGREFRNALSLRSTFITWDATEDHITFHTKGYGHGVGMSQAGANAMAAAALDYRAILAHYYPGTELTSCIKEHETNPA